MSQEEKYGADLSFCSRMVVNLSHGTNKAFLTYFMKINSTRLIYTWGLNYSKNFK